MQMLQVRLPIAKSRAQILRVRLTFTKSRVQNRIGRTPVHGITCDQPDNKAYPHGSCVWKSGDQGVPVPPSLPPPPDLGLRAGLVAGK